MHSRFVPSLWIVPRSVHVRTVTDKFVPWTPFVASFFFFLHFILDFSFKMRMKKLKKNKINNSSFVDLKHAVFRQKSTTDSTHQLTVPQSDPLKSSLFVFSLPPHIVRLHVTIRVCVPVPECRRIKKESEERDKNHPSKLSAQTILCCNVLTCRRPCYKFQICIKIFFRRSDSTPLNVIAC